MLALYLMTAPHSTIAGVFRLPDGYICEDLGWTSGRVTKGLSELFAKGFANRCETSKWVWIRKHLAWNPPENPNQRKAAKKLALQIPDECQWKQAFMHEWGGFLDIPREQFGNPSETVSEPFPKAFANQEQEQEQEYLRGAEAPPKASVVQMPEPVIVARLPLVDGSEHKVVREKVGKWAQAYPAVQVERELAAMASWLEANPKNRKTPAGIERFIVGWLGKAQDRAARTPGDLLRGAQRDDPFAGAK